MAIIIGKTVLITQKVRISNKMRETTKMTKRKNESNAINQILWSDGSDSDNSNKNFQTNVKQIVQKNKR